MLLALGTKKKLEFVDDLIPKPKAETNQEEALQENCHFGTDNFHPCLGGTQEHNYDANIQI